MYKLELTEKKKKMQFRINNMLFDTQMLRRYSLAGDNKAARCLPSGVTTNETAINTDSSWFLVLEVQTQ